MSNKKNSSELSLLPIDNQRLLNLCGKLDEHLHFIEQSLNVEIHHRSGVFHIFGNPPAVKFTRALLLQLYEQTKDTLLTLKKVQLCLQQGPTKSTKEPYPSTDLSIKTPQEFIKAHSANQKKYIHNIRTNDVIFGIGPAGTGKTYLAVACAVEALEAEQVQRILLVRPAVEAGEKLGFLPGDLSQKIDPYLRPLYDALYEMLGFERVNKLIERNIIELAPLAYMRGRTLNDAFIILDESQNTTRQQMKMFLTRLGFNSTTVITGDITQVDLPPNIESGLKHAMHVLQNIPKVNFTHFDAQDVIRHPIVQKIVNAYEKEDASPHVAPPSNRY